MRVVAMTMVVLMMVTMKARGWNFKSVSRGQAGLWGVRDDGTVFYYLMFTDLWMEVDEKKLKQLDVGTNIVWGVDSDDNIYYRSGITTFFSYGRTWNQTEGKMKHVSVSPRGHVWAVNSKDEVFVRTGVTASAPGGTSWLQMRGKLSQISAGRSGVWGVDSNKNVYYRRNTYEDNDREGTLWIRVYGLNMTYVSSGFASVFGIADGKLYKREDMSCHNPTGTKWSIVENMVNLKVVDSFDVHLCVIYMSTSDPQTDNFQCSYRI